MPMHYAMDKSPKDLRTLVEKVWDQIMDGCDNDVVYETLEQIYIGLNGDPKQLDNG
jgi:hypothetical protein